MNYAAEIDQPHFRLVGEVADEMGVECYVIGGWVRDMFLRRHSTDVDFVCVGNGIELAERVAKRYGRRAKLSVFKHYGTAQVKIKGMELEFVGARKESYHLESRNPDVEPGTLQEDQERRDFTINALALCLNKERYGELLDPFGGLQDIDNLVIRTPLDPDITFSDDPLRMMRGIRFASQLGFFLETETFNAIERNRERIRIITVERIDEELNKILLSPRPSVGLTLLDKTGLLDIILPELAALKSVATEEIKGHKDNLAHTFQVVDNVAKQTDKLWLLWAALLHDIGKARVKRHDPKLGWTFHNHDIVGQRMVKKLFTRMKLPLNEKMQYVMKLVGLHMRPINLADEGVTDSAIRRLLFDAGDDIDDLMTLSAADVTSKNPAKVKRISDNYEIIRRKLVEIEAKDRIRNYQPPVDGVEIMNLFGLGPGKMIGVLKTMEKEAILDGIIPNEHDAALEYVKKMYEKIKDQAEAYTPRRNN